MTTTARNIAPDLTMAEVLEIYPGAQRALFRQYHIGGCSSCGFQPTETLAGVCARNDDLPVKDVIAFLGASQEEDAKMFISPRDLAAELEKENVRLLDIRTREEFDAVHIEGSQLFSQELLQEISATWPREQAFVIIDHQGKRALDAATYFAGHGFTAVKGLAGGIDLWSQEVDPDLPRYHLE
ncbi:MAG TPA: rhodanese-like domain-containing protein [Chthoniobacterales bacterium]